MKETSGRKIDHIKLSMVKSVESNEETGFKDVKLIHMSLPEINLCDVDVRIKFLKHKLLAPLVIESITGGAHQAIKINNNLAEAAEDLGVAIGVGSQRAALEDKKLIDTYSIVRDKAPSVPVFANLGAPQLLDDNAIDYALEAIEMLKANALIVHLNVLQEAVQPEGQTNFSGVIKKLSEIIKKIGVPVIAKETGAGISIEIAKQLKLAGVKIIDVGGLGGTSWAAVEYYRALKARKRQKANLGKTFWDWGIPTAASLVETKSVDDIICIASGGIRNGLEVAKAIALGADLVGMARPLLKPATQNSTNVKKVLKKIIEELKTAMFLTGAKNIASLRDTPIVISGFTKEWLIQRGFEIKSLTKRRPQIKRVNY
jgi:isopentenyl-diphosphate delta-isomerase